MTSAEEVIGLTRFNAWYSDNGTQRHMDVAKEFAGISAQRTFDAQPRLLNPDRVIDHLAAASLAGDYRACVYVHYLTQECKFLRLNVVAQSRGRLSNIFQLTHVMNVSDQPMTKSEIDFVAMACFNMVHSTVQSRILTHCFDRFRAVAKCIQQLRKALCRELSGGDVEPQLPSTARLLPLAALAAAAGRKHLATALVCSLRSLLGGLANYPSSSVKAPVRPATTNEQSGEDGEVPRTTKRKHKDEENEQQQQQPLAARDATVSANECLNPTSQVDLAIEMATALDPATSARMLHDRNSPKANMLMDQLETIIHVLSDLAFCICYIMTLHGNARAAVYFGGIAVKLTDHPSAAHTLARLRPKLPRATRLRPDQRPLCTMHTWNRIACAQGHTFAMLEAVDLLTHTHIDAVRLVQSKRSKAEAEAVVFARKTVIPALPQEAIMARVHHMWAFTYMEHSRCVNSHSWSMFTVHQQNCWATIFQSFPANQTTNSAWCLDLLQAMHDHNINLDSVPVSHITSSWSHPAGSDPSCAVPSSQNMLEYYVANAPGLGTFSITDRHKIEHFLHPPTPPPPQPSTDAATTTSTTGFPRNLHLALIEYGVTHKTTAPDTTATTGSMSVTNGQQPPPPRRSIKNWNTTMAIELGLKRYRVRCAMFIGAHLVGAGAGGEHTQLSEDIVRLVVDRFTAETSQRIYDAPLVMTTTTATPGTDDDVRDMLMSSGIRVQSAPLAVCANAFADLSALVLSHVRPQFTMPQEGPPEALLKLITEGRRRFVVRIHDTATILLQPGEAWLLATHCRLIRDVWDEADFEQQQEEVDVTTTLLDVHHNERNPRCKLVYANALLAMVAYLNGKEHLLVHFDATHDLEEYALYAPTTEHFCRGVLRASIREATEYTSHARGYAVGELEPQDARGLDQSWVLSNWQRAFANKLDTDGLLQLLSTAVFLDCREVAYVACEALVRSLRCVPWARFFDVFPALRAHDSMSAMSAIIDKWGIL